MSAIKELLKAETDGTLSFGDYELAQKTKLSDFDHDGDLYKVKTYKDITRLEKNDSFLYESVPGTAVSHLEFDPEGAAFLVEGPKDAQLTLELEEDTAYEVLLNGVAAGTMKTNLSGKLSFSVELTEGEAVKVEIRKQ